MSIRRVVGVLAALGLVLTVLGVSGLLRSRNGPARQSVTSMLPPQHSTAAADAGAGTGVAERTSTSRAPAVGATSTSKLPGPAMPRLPSGGAAAPPAPGSVGERVSPPPSGLQPAVARAASFMKLYARPAPGGERGWLERVPALMTPEAAVEAAAVDPARVPFVRVTGPAGPVAGDGLAPAGWALVAVPTDAGVYVVQLQAAAPYAVSRVSRVEG